MTLYTGNSSDAVAGECGIEYEHDGTRYSLGVENATIEKIDERIKIYARDGACTLRPCKSK